MDGFYRKDLINCARHFNFHHHPEYMVHIGKLVNLYKLAYYSPIYVPLIWLVCMVTMVYIYSSSTWLHCDWATTVKSTVFFTMP